MTKEEFTEKVKLLDLTWIIKKITQKDPNIAKVWTEEGAKDAMEQYKNFMFLLYKYKGKNIKIVPSIEVDEIWHHHILDTQRYQKDCQNIYGHFMHHSPYFGLRDDNYLKELNKDFMITQELYFKEFGDYMYEVDF
ncbi:glycine-rich domain-containing protein [Xenorhabdus sp. KK7.4]|uniref:glycine-rich domain-containing protein n=1 Tax=Xenorhabdus sp. KK7.4 TaxID=1851572 RepID=UPI000C03929F|nr:glycine-rich domain-containing protein-like [Xenorhabdus sp. KK7.4]PHM52891.1 hypothetical protein Xekk_03009 [Xenorhabdus sp. KK7.4]